jgi:RNA polymerase sigma-70 factor, ECF subfamily
MNDFLTDVEAAIPGLRRYALALTRDADGADDLVQDCLERALTRCRLWRPTETVKSWLFTILHTNLSVPAVA